MTYDELKEMIMNASIDLTLDSIGRAIADVLEEGQAREIINSIERHI